ncbi:MAG: hypothetical protein WCJ96_00655 [Verrucomicrobiota bacterium]
MLIPQQELEVLYGRAVERMFGQPPEIRRSPHFDWTHLDFTVDRSSWSISFHALQHPNMLSVSQTRELADEYADSPRLLRKLNELNGRFIGVKFTASGQQPVRIIARCSSVLAAGRCLPHSELVPQAINESMEQIEKALGEFRLS